MMVVGCETTPAKESIVGTYERKSGEVAYRWGVLENNILEYYMDGQKAGKAKWAVAGKEVRVEYENGIVLFRNNIDDSLTRIAKIDRDGKRTDIPKDLEWTFQNIY